MSADSKEQLLFQFRTEELPKQDMALLYVSPALTAKDIHDAGQLRIEESHRIYAPAEYRANDDFKDPAMMSPTSLGSAVVTWCTPQNETVLGFRNSDLAQLTETGMVTVKKDKPRVRQTVHDGLDVITNHLQRYAQTLGSTVI